MALTAANAKICADAFCTTAGITDAAAVLKWEELVQQLYASLKTDIGAILPASSVVTTGSATTQTGPAAPVPIVIS